MQITAKALAGSSEGVVALIETARSMLRNKGEEVFWVAPDATVFDAIALMAEKGIGALVVLADGKLVGIMSERDYARKVFLQGRHSKETAVLEIMTSPVVTVTPDTRVHECMRLVTEKRIRHLPVVERDRVVGMISIGDLVNTVMSAQAETIRQLSDYISGKYPA
jgi:CBS domain-containing protein